MTYRDEFPDFDPSTLPAIPSHWADVSWRNDACPSWGAGSVQGGSVYVYVDYADPARREHRGVARFSAVASYAAQFRVETILDSDDWAAILAAVESATS